MLWGPLLGATALAPQPAGRRISLSQGWAPLLFVQCRVVGPETVCVQQQKQTQQTVFL